jgi:hypothetical protein
VEQKADEFYNFRQEGKLVGDYAAEFDRLSKYCPQLVQTETDRVLRFVNGLRLDLKKALIGIAPATVGAVVEIASRIDGVELERGKHKGKEGQRPSAQKRSGQPEWLRDKYPRQGESSSTKSNIACYQCGKGGHKAADCRQYKLLAQPMKCFRCGKEGHKANVYI